MSKDTILFDLDGTLLNTLTDLTAAVNHAMRGVGLKERTEDEVRMFLGDGYALLIERACGGKEHVEEALKLFNDYYSVHLEDNTRPYEGVVEAVKRLSERGKKMAIVSNKGDAAVKVLCKRFFAPYITEYFGVTETLKKKPAPDMLYAAMQALGSEKSDCVMVGDGEPDIMMAKAAGIDIISVTWGFRTEEFLKSQGGKVFLHKTEELSEI